MTDPVFHPEFSRPVRLEDIARADMDLDLTASAPECEALARRFEVAEVTALEAKVTLRRIAAGVFTASGTLESEIVFIGEHAEEAQDFSVSEVIDEVFATEIGWKSLSESSLDGEIDAELLTADHIDIGEVVAQNLSLALEPALLESVSLDDGAVTYSAGSEDGDSTSNHPFAALAALRDRERGGGDSSMT